MKYFSFLLLPLLFLPFVGNAKVVKKTVKPVAPVVENTPVEIVPVVEKPAVYKIDGIYASPFLRTQARYQKVEKMIAENTANGKTLSADAQANWDTVNKNIELAKSYVDQLSSIKSIDPNAKFFASKQNTIDLLRDNINDSNKRLYQIVINIYK